MATVTRARSRGIVGEHGCGCPCPRPTQRAARIFLSLFACDLRHVSHSLLACTQLALGRQMPLSAYTVSCQRDARPTLINEAVVYRSAGSQLAQSLLLMLLLMLLLLLLRGQFESGVGTAV